MGEGEEEQISKGTSPKEREGGGEGTSQDAWYGQHRLSCDGTAGRNTAEHRSELMFDGPLPKILVSNCPRGRTPLEDCWNRTVLHIGGIISVIELAGDRRHEEGQHQAALILGDVTALA